MKTFDLVKPRHSMMFQEKLNNVSSWLVARFAIVENFLQIILKPMYCLEGSLLWHKNGRAFFWKKQPVIAEKQLFSQKR